MTKRHADETVERTYAPAASSAAVALSIAREGRAPFVISLPPGTSSVGRDPEAAICLRSPSLSRLHVALDVQKEAVFVRDLGSRNGTRLDGAPIGSEPVSFGFGSEVAAGDVKLMLMRADHLPRAARPLLLLGAFEERFVSLAEPTARAVIHLELEKAVDDGSGVGDALALLPEDTWISLLHDEGLLVAALDASTGPWLLQALAQRGVAVRRTASSQIRAGAPDASRALAALLRGAPEVDAGKSPDDVPRPFRYPSLGAIFAQLRKIAPRSLNVLVRGETGTGKEVFAREVHRLSRRTGPLVSVNTAALPEALIESELFGHEKGAFSGAVAAKAGLIESADRGTLFLDEIGELSLPLQAKLLRVLEDQSVRRVGSNVEKKIDVRVVAATHQDLEALAAEKKFRQDLLFRLDGATFVLPPLRERRGELPALAGHLLSEMADAAGVVLSPEALVALEAYAFPGNVRELKHVLERAVALADGGQIGVDHLPASVLRGPRAAAAAPSAATAPSSGDVRSSVRDFEKDRILAALREAGGNRTRAAELLGLPRRTLVYKLSKLGITGD